MTATSETQPHTRLTRVPGYLTWFASDTARELSGSLIRFAVPLVALVVTGSPAQAGVIGAVGAAVGVATTLVGGVMADQRRRATLMLVGACLGVVLAAAFAVLDAFGAWTFTLLLLMNVLLRMRDGLFDTAGETLLKDIAPDDAMGRAQAANQGRGAVLQLVGGPLGGLLLGIGGWLIGLVALVCQVISAAMALILGRHVVPARQAELAAEAQPRESFGSQLKMGLAWTFSRRDLRGVVVAATIINLGFNAATTIIIYALQQEGLSMAKIGWVSAVSGGAMLLGALCAPALIARVPAGVIVISGLAIAAGGIVALTGIESFAAILGVMAASVILIPALNAALFGYFMVAVPSDLLGRASSAVQVLSMAAMPLAPIVAGFGLAHLGRAGTLMIAAMLCVIAAGVALSNRGIRSLPVEKQWADHATQFAHDPAKL